MKIEILIEKLQEIAKENPGIDVASWWGREMEEEFDFCITYQETKEKGLFVQL